MERFDVFSDPRAETLAAAVSAIAGDVHATAPRTWCFELPGRKRRATARLGEHWLEIESPLGSSRLVTPARIRRYLRRNAAEGDGARIVESAVARRPRIVVDVPAELLPWSEPSALAAVIGHAIAALRAAAGKREVDAAGGDADALDAGTVVQLFEDARWPAQSRAGEQPHVLLEVPGFYADAEIVTRPSCIGIRARVLEAEYAGAAAICCDAIAMLLWHAASALRMVKPSLRNSGPVLEVSAAAEPAALAHACAALSVALTSVLPEASTLVADEDLARTYLAVIGFDGNSQKSHPGRLRPRVALSSNDRRQ